VFLIPIVISVATPGPDWSARWTAIGTVALAAVTVIAIATTIVITIQDRRRADVREQYAEAYKVRVVQAERDAGPPTDPVYEQASGSSKRLGAVIINEGAYTITGIEARLRLADCTVQEFAGSERVTGTTDLDPRLSDGMEGQLEAVTHGDRLAPWDIGLRFYSERRPIAVWYPIVRWTDRWGKRWEHRLGDVRRVKKRERWRA
jgi:hypothetical protein